MHQNPQNDEIRALLERSTTIAVVGASGNPERPSYGVMKTLQHAGFKVIPVNPKETEILGERVYASLADIPVAVDIVDVFRKAEDTPPIADEAVRIKAKAFWLQPGIVSEEAAARASAGGLVVVMDLCVGATVSRLGISKRTH